MEDLLLLCLRSRTPTERRLEQTEKYFELPFTRADVLQEETKFERLLMPSTLFPPESGSLTRGDVYPLEKVSLLHPAVSWEYTSLRQSPSSVDASEFVSLTLDSSSVLISDK